MFRRTAGLFAVPLILVSLGIPTYSVAIGFGPAKTYATGKIPYGVAVNDFNGDFKLDLVVTNAGSASVSVLLGNGNGTFQPAVNYTVGQGPQSVAVGDFNGDRKSDLAVVNSGDGTVSIMLGNGDGTFQAATTYTVGQDPQWVAVADFNGDHKLDLAVANHGDPSVCGDGAMSILLGKGDGTFQSAANYNAGTCPNSVTAGDLNADGKLDLVTQAEVFIGNGDGTFQSPVSLNWGTGQAPGPVVVADFNHDGKQDLAGTLSPGAFIRKVEILLGNGDGTFQSPVSYNGGALPLSIAVADFDLDGALDLATTYVEISQVNVLAGNGDGTFQLPVNFSIGPNHVMMATGDFNGDNLPDLVFTNDVDNDVSVILNTTHMTISPDFSLSPASADLTLQPGAQGPDVITIASQNGSFGNDIQLTCAVAGPAPMPTCALSPSSVTPGAGSVISTLTVTAPAASAMQFRPSYLRLSKSLCALGLPLMFGIALVGGSKTGRRSWLCCGLLLLLLILQTACGGSNSSSGTGNGATSPTNYTVTVAGASGAIQHTTEVTITVQ